MEWPWVALWRMLSGRRRNGPDVREGFARQHRYVYRGSERLVIGEKVVQLICQILDITSAEAKGGQRLGKGRQV